MKIIQHVVVPAIALLIAIPGFGDVTQHKLATPVINDGVSTTTKQLGANKSLVDYTKNQLRCWQDGDLIVAESDWQLPDKSQAKVLHKANQKMYFYNFNETFCIYIED